MRGDLWIPPYFTVAEIYNYRKMPESTTIEGIFSCKQASHCWPDDGNSSTAPLPIYEKGLSLNTGDRRHVSMPQSQEEYSIVVGFRQLLVTPGRSSRLYWTSYYLA
jgi:hypothetical protein